MFKRILVATDGSEYSHHALSAAVEIARKFGSQIELIHIVNQPLTYAGIDYASYIYTFTEDQINDIGSHIIDKTLKGIDAIGVMINKKVVSGYPAAVILDEIKRDIDLVVMGTRGHGPIEGAVTGSVTQRVLAEASCPVLIVK